MSGFPTTAWTVVSRARRGAEAEARETGEALRDGNGDLIKYNFGNTMEWRADGVLPPANPDGFPVNDVDLVTAIEGVLAGSSPTR